MFALRRAGNLSRGHQETRKILKRKKRTDTQYDNKARFDGQKFGKPAGVCRIYEAIKVEITQIPYKTEGIW